jgi:hypothetical protein
MSTSSLGSAVRRSCWSARWRVALAVAIAAVGGCNRVLPFQKSPPKLPRPTIFLASNRNVDLLFLVDDSSSMTKSQDNLLRNFPVLMQTLENLPGGLPNVHIAVVSSDMGAGDGSISECDPNGGKKGVFQFAPRGACTSSGLAPGATFISNIGGQKNYTGALPDVFTCIAALGEQGCGFEHQFAAITRALGVDGNPAPAENAGFLRPDALLAIVMITNEDDCSAAPGVALYNTASNSDLMSKLGPLDNFRCNEFGHICDGGHPGRFAPNNDPNATVSYTDCISNETEGFLLGVEDTATRLRTLKADDGQIMVAAITGPRAPYVVGWVKPRTQDRSCGQDVCPWPEIRHSCMADDGSFGDPSIRIAQLVDEFHDNGRLISICDGDFAPALGSIADNIAKYVQAPCIEGQIAKKSGTSKDDCSVTDNVTGKPIPSCADTGDAGLCWRLVAGGTSCSGLAVAVQPDPTGATASSQNITVQCSLCAPGVTDAPRGCP